MKPTHEEFFNKIDEFINENNPTLSFGAEDKVSSILLYKDFIRRLYLWKTELNLPFLMYGKKEIFNLLNDINPVWLNDLVSFEDYEQYIINNYTYSSSNLNYFFLYLFIYWEFYKNSEEIQEYNYLEQPYESVIKIFANKNNIYKRDVIIISGVSIIYGNKDFKLPSLDDNFLNFIDSKCKLMGSNGIPNQERVNELWEEFQSLKQ